MASKRGKQQNRLCRRLRPLIDKLIGGGDDLCGNDSKMRLSNNGETRFAPEKEQAPPACLKQHHKTVANNTIACSALFRF